MVQAFTGERMHSIAFKRFEVSGETLARIVNAKTLGKALPAYELSIRQKLVLITFQNPEKIAGGIRFISDVELWNGIAKTLGASDSDKQEKAKLHKRALSIIVDRRNKIAHEGDMQPNLPRDPWPIEKNDLVEVRKMIFDVVNSIGQLVWAEHQKIETAIPATPQTP
jgi:RiboL-PSP-HEPN